MAGILRDTQTDIVVNFLPVGSQRATEWYAEQALAAGCGFVNCIPVFIAREPAWQARFRAARLPVVGDDVKSQVGATIVHRALARLFMDRGVRLEHTSQLNVGGNTDFYNMLDRERLASKKASKTDAVRSQILHDLAGEDIHIGPSDHVPWLRDRKWAHIRLEGRGFGDQPITVELKLEVWDSPNSAGVVIDAVRACKLAMDRGLGGALDAPSAYLMKSPPEQWPDEIGAGAPGSIHRGRPRALTPAASPHAIVREPDRSACPERSGRRHLQERDPEEGQLEVEPHRAVRLHLMRGGRSVRLEALAGAEPVELSRGRVFRAAQSLPLRVRVRVLAVDPPVVDDRRAAERQSLDRERHRSGSVFPPGVRLVPDEDGRARRVDGRQRVDLSSGRGGASTSRLAVDVAATRVCPSRPRSRRPFRMGFSTFSLVTRVRLPSNQRFPSM